MTLDAINDYLKAGFGGKLEVQGKIALLVVDPLVAYIDQSCPLYAGVESAAETMKRLVLLGRKKEIPIFITRVEHDTKGLTGGVFVKKVPALQYLSRDSLFGAYIEGLEPLAKDVEIVKQYPSAFAHTPLQSALTAAGVGTVLITGFSTSGCIRATATDAMQNGFVPYVVTDGVGDRLEQVHLANLYDIQAKIGETITSEVALEIMRRE